MDSTVFAVMLIACAVAALFALMLVRAGREEKRKTEKAVADSWGRVLPRLYLPEEIREIRRYADSRTSEGAGEFSVDSVTAGDVELDRVFAAVSGTLSSPGDEVLYSWLMHPLTDRERIAERVAWEERFLSDENLRLETGRILAECGKLRGASFYGAVSSLDGAAEIGGSKYAVLGGLTFGAFILLFFAPVAALVLLVPLLFLDFRVHLEMKRKIGAGLRGFRAILRMEKAAGEIARRYAETVNTETENAGPKREIDLRKLGACAAELAPFRRSSFWVLSEGSVGTGAGDAALEYVRMLFHPDLVAYDRMLRLYREKREQVYSLFEGLGALDAAMSAASFLKNGVHASRPEFADGPEAFLEVRDLCHPLLTEPVPNSLSARGGVLITGSNASGKSTFLKSTALAAILAQSIGVVPASYYRAPCFRIYSSMALTDNLIGGESYFVVEIRSLKRIWEAVAAGGTPVLALVDEVLRGTNTVERVSASTQILRNLVTEGSLIFAATHDVELTSLLADNYRNIHFEEAVSDGDVRFDYRIREGRASARNALRLLRENGCPEEVVAAAERQAGHFEKEGEWRA